VEGLASAATSRRLGFRAGLADDHSTAPRDAKDATVGKRREEDVARASFPSSTVPSATASPPNKGAGDGIRSLAGAFGGGVGGSTSGERRTHPNRNGTHDKGKALETPLDPRTERSVVEPARPDARVPPKKKTVRFAPEAVFFEKKNEKRFPPPREKEKGTSLSLRPPSRKRRKPLLDISRNAHRDGVSSEERTPTVSSAAAKRNRRYTAFAFGARGGAGS